ncbi:MAG: glycosyltransferase family 61 protein [Enhydrobacter sp.]|nr:glycosyltransferase family 61 protein [Enhydrobacter sp.]
MIRRLLPEPDKARLGCHEISPGIHLEVLEERSWKQHAHVRASLPDGEAIEPGFFAGPIFSFSCAESFIDVRAGITFVGDEPLYEPVLSRKVFERYGAPATSDFDDAQALAPGSVMLPLASPKMKNYCRFWLDSMAKLFVCQQSAHLRALSSTGQAEIVAPKLKLGFQREAVSLVRPQNPPRTVKRSRLVRGRSVNSTGVVFGGGQRVGRLVRDFARYLHDTIPRSDSTTAASDSTSDLVYVSRNDSSMRRVLNEETEIVPVLRDLGFDIVRPGEMSLVEQIERFRRARVIVAPHGAALTNLLFCRPGLALVEIFPRGGVHGSMFLRMASHLGFDYHFVVGEASGNAASQTNPNNADIVLDAGSLASFLRDVIG